MISYRTSGRFSVPEISPPFALLLVTAISPETVAPSASLRASCALLKVTRTSIGKPASDPNPTLPRAETAPLPARPLNSLISNRSLVKRPVSLIALMRVP